jgi:hypothetical protein
VGACYVDVSEIVLASFAYSVYSLLANRDFHPMAILSIVCPLKSTIYRQVENIVQWQLKINVRKSSPRVFHA